MSTQTFANLKIDKQTGGPGIIEIPVGDGIYMPLLESVGDKLYLNSQLFTQNTPPPPDPNPDPDPGPINDPIVNIEGLFVDSGTNYVNISKSNIIYIAYDGTVDQLNTLITNGSGSHFADFLPSSNANIYVRELNKNNDNNKRLTIGNFDGVLTLFDTSVSHIPSIFTPGEHLGGNIEFTFNPVSGEIYVDKNEIVINGVAQTPNDSSLTFGVGNMIPTNVSGIHVVEIKTTFIDGDTTTIQVGTVEVQEGGTTAISLQRQTSSSRQMNLTTGTKVLDVYANLNSMFTSKYGLEDAESWNTSTLLNSIDFNVTCAESNIVSITKMYSGIDAIAKGSVSDESNVTFVKCSGLNVHAGHLDNVHLCSLEVQSDVGVEVNNIILANGNELWDTKEDTRLSLDDFRHPARVILR